MNTHKVLFIFAFILSCCIIIVTTTHILSTNYINNYKYNKFNDISNRYINNLNLKTFNFLKYINFGINYLNLFTIFNSSLDDFISLSTLRNDELINELRIHYFVSLQNRSIFETQLSNNLKRPINFISVDHTPLPQYTFYCPITYISPNTSLTVYNYIGLDICNLEPFNNLISTLNSTNDIVILPRSSIISNSIILDIAQKTNTGLSTVSITIPDFLTFIDNEIMINNINHVIYYKQNILYTSCGQSNCVNSLVYKRQILFGNNTDYLIDLYYPNENSFNILSLLVGIGSLLLLIISSILLYTSWKNEKKGKSLEKYQFASEMLGYVNHEIRNPLNSIQGLINISIYDLQQIIEKHPELNLIISNLGTAENSCELLNHIVNDILDIKKIQENKLMINYSPLSLRLFGKDLYKTISLKIHEKPLIKYTYNLHNNLDYIITDRHRLLQVMINFITNALKFTESGSVSVDVKKEKIKNIDWICFSVTDTGRGISDNKRALIFQPYSQVEVLDSLRGSGVGLGLHLCKMITECFGGIIGFDSTENKGSTFYIKLKLIIPEIDKINIIDNI